MRRAAALAFALVAAACAPTYSPACLGDASHPLAATALAQPSGLALAGDRLYVANAASSSPGGDYDYCGSFISVLDPATGEPLRAPLLPEDLSRAKDDRTYRFFSDITYDTRRDVLYVAERQRSSVLKVDPASGRVLSRTEAGHGPYSLLFVPGVDARWPDGSHQTRDVVVVADIGRAGNPGHLYVIDADEFSFGAAREIDLPRSGRPAGLTYDAATRRAYVTQFDGLGVLGLNLETLQFEFASEAVLAGYPLYIRGVAPVTTSTPPRLYFTSESEAYHGIWQADADSGQLLDRFMLPVAPFSLAVYGDRLVGLASNRLYLLEREPLRLAQTLLLDTKRPARMLIDAAAKRAYVTSTDPSTVRIVELP